MAATKSLSEQSLVAPYRLIGLAALSVLSAITCLHVAVDGRVDEIGAAEHVGLDHFDGIVLSRWHLLERRSMNDDIDAVHSAVEPVAVAHVADEVAQRRIALLR